MVVIVAGRHESDSPAADSRGRTTSVEQRIRPRHRFMAQGVGKDVSGGAAFDLRGGLRRAVEAQLGAQLGETPLGFDVGRGLLDLEHA